MSFDVLSLRAWKEHRNAFKNGNDFCLCHSIYRYVPSHTVRKRRLVARAELLGHELSELSR